jgi:hypothetical protein
MQHGDLDKTKVLKTQRDSKSDVSKPKFQECVEFCPTGQTGIAHRSDPLDISQSKSGPFTRFQRHFLDLSDLVPDMSSEQYDRWNLNSTGLVRPFFRHVRVLN